MKKMYLFKNLDIVLICITLVVNQNIFASEIKETSISETLDENIATNEEKEKSKIDYSSLQSIHNVSLASLSKNGLAYGKWEQDQNGDLFFIFSNNSQKSLKIAMNGWYAIEDREVSENITISPADKILANVISSKRIDDLSDVEIAKIIDAKTFSWYHFDEKGILQTGWYREGKDTYFLSRDDNEKGKMCIGEKTIDGEVYTFSSNPITLGILQ